jgi:hypothetical protein
VALTLEREVMRMITFGRDAHDDPHAHALLLLERGIN